MTVLQNNTQGTYIHGEYRLKPNEILDVPQKIAKTWLKVDGIVEYVDPEKAREAMTKATEAYKALETENEKLKAEIEKLKAEIEKLKAEIEKLKAENKTKKTNKK